MRLLFVRSALGMLAALGCAGTKPASAPTPAARPTANGAGPVAAAGREGGGGRGDAGGRAGQPGPGGPGGPGGARRGGPPNFERQDSIRVASVEQLLKEIKGRESEPAGKVFKSVQFSKDMPAKAFLTMMNEQYGRGTGNVCTGCHESAIVNGANVVNYASDKPKDKKIARDMERMQQSINKELAKNQASKGIDDDYPKASCVMCHRGTAHMPNTMKSLKNTDPLPQTRVKGPPG